MTPTLIITALIALALGYYLGSRKGQSSMSFTNKPFARTMRAKAHEAIDERIDERKARILKHAQHEGRITNDDVEDMFCISDATARNYLNELEGEGKLTQHGSTGRGVYYTLNQ